MSVFLVYLFCLVIGFVFVLGSTLLGSLGGDHGHVGGSHGHAETGADNSDSPGVSLFSPIIIAAFVTAFGAFGLVCLQFKPTESPAISTVLSLVGAMVVAGGLVAFLRKIVRASDSSSESKVSTLVGHLATVISPIPSGGMGEIAYVQAGTRYTAPAREERGIVVAAGAEVKITRIVGSQFFVTSTDLTPVSKNQ